MGLALERATTAAIIANALAFGWGVVDHAHAEQAEMVEHLILGFFVAEMALELWGQRLAYFRQPWHCFGAAVIALSLLPVLPGAAVLRLARLARIAKLLHLARHATQLKLLELRRAT